MERSSWVIWSRFHLHSRSHIWGYTLSRSLTDCGCLWWPISFSEFKKAMQFKAAYPQSGDEEDSDTYWVRVHWWMDGRGREGMEWGANCVYISRVRRYVYCGDRVFRAVICLSKPDFYILLFLSIPPTISCRSFPDPVAHFPIYQCRYGVVGVPDIFRSVRCCLWMNEWLWFGPDLLCLDCVLSLSLFLTFVVLLVGNFVSLNWMVWMWWCHVIDVLYIFSCDIRPLGGTTPLILYVSPRLFFSFLSPVIYQFATCKAANHVWICPFLWLGITCAKL